MDDDALPFDEPLSVYVGELDKIPALSRAEEIDCVEHIRAGDQIAASAEKRLIEANLLLIVSIAVRYRNDCVPILKLIQEGNLGLVRAVRTLGDSSQDSFSAHATSHIERAVVEAITASGSTGETHLSS
ncbi:MAG: sigma factor [Bryobacteraceae bacterium]